MIPLAVAVVLQVGGKPRASGDDPARRDAKLARAA